MSLVVSAFWTDPATGESSEFTELETPIFTCVALSLRKALDALDGVPSAVAAGA